MKMQIDYEAIGRRIRNARNGKKMTQETLANQIDVTPTYISTIENGHTKISLPTLMSIANALSTTVDCLLYNNTTVLVTQYDATAKEILDGCTPAERKYLLGILRDAKKNLVECRLLR